MDTDNPLFTTGFGSQPWDTYPGTACLICSSSLICTVSITIILLLQSWFFLLIILFCYCIVYTLHYFHVSFYKYIFYTIVYNIS